MSSCRSILNKQRTSQLLPYMLTVKCKYSFEDINVNDEKNEALL